MRTQRHQALFYNRRGNVMNLRPKAAYQYNGQNRMIYSEVTSHVEKSRATSRYAYDALGRRTVSQDAGGSPLRTLYDGFSFEVIREGETLSDGSFTTRYSEGIQRTNNTGTEGSRYRWIGEGTENVKTRSLYEDGYGAGPGRFTGISVTLYGKGEAVAVSRSASTGSRGGAAYLGKDLLGSVRSTTNEYGSLEDRYEYDAFGKPYAGDLTSGMNLGYTGKPYDTATGLYNYGYRDYQPEAARFTTMDPVRDGANWFAYVNNDPVNWVDLWGFDSFIATYMHGSGKITAIYVATSNDRSIDPENTKTYTFNASNKVSTKQNTTIPANENEPEQHYYPQSFPTGTWEMGISVPVPPSHPLAPYMGDTYIPTNAKQTVQTYGPATSAPSPIPIGTQEDRGYGLHYSPGGTTAGCIAFGSQEEADQFAALSDRALGTKGGTSTLTVKCGD
jgi:RHS repeat-associated protein